MSNAAATTTGASVELDLNAAGLVNEAAVETVKFSDGSTVNFDANGQKNGPKFYTKPRAFAYMPTTSSSSRASRRLSRL